MLLISNVNIDGNDDYDCARHDDDNDDNGEDDGDDNLTGTSWKFT